MMSEKVIKHVFFFKKKLYLKKYKNTENKILLLSEFSIFFNFVFKNYFQITKQKTHTCS